MLVLAGVGSTLFGQEPSKYIVVDRFGYLPDSKKVAVIRDPRTGFDAEESFTPGSWYCLVNAVSGEKVFRGNPSQWKSGATDPSSGDRAWQFDFTQVSETGRYYVLDEERKVRSYEFVIAPNAYNEVLRQAMRSFFYQRAGFAKEAQFAGEEWADGASHVGALQDLNCRSFFDKDNPGTEQDVSGGWYDAGDYNKYTSWTADYVTEMMKMYLERPEAWGDDYNIPESGNGIPDILDEALWGIKHLLRLQQPGGAVLSIVGESHASPPSSATGPSYYGPPNTSATLKTCAAFAIASGVYRSAGMESLADTLISRALSAWEWAGLYPDSLFNNNDPAYNSQGLGAGRMEIDDYGRAMAKLKAACYLLGDTGESRFRDWFDNHYQEAHMFQWNFVYPYEAENQEMLLFYTTLAEGTESVQTHIRNVYRNAMLNNADNLPAYNGNEDPYGAHMDSYTWGSNGVKSSQGSMSYNLIAYGMDDGLTATAGDAAEGYIHYIHGNNPLNMVYLSNMYPYGAENAVNEFYHSWFCNGSPLWDRVGTSTYGPAPGYLTGGPNPSYDWDGCCPSGCGSGSNNQMCFSESISPPKDQPPQKSYKDFNTSWPLNSWSVTENSCGYQVRYVRLLSKFVTAGMDCNGDVDGGAFIDSCGICAGGSTGIIPSLDPGSCNEPPGPAGGDTMYIEGRHLYTAAGEKVILRGVNEMFVWSDDPTGERLIPEIAQTGANAVRLVWTEEYGQKGKLVELIERTIGHRMIAIPECHSATGEWDLLDVCISFWKDPVLMEGIQRNRGWTLVNIGNEVGDGNVTAVQFSAGYRRAIDSLRGWGYTVPIVIDASTWGQNVDVIFDTWKEIQEHDPLHNILFSVHSYWPTTDNYQRVATESINEGLPVIIGEGPSPTAYPTCNILDYGTGLEVAGENELGWLSWSWGGLPNGHCVPNFDHTYDGIFGRWRTTYAEEMMAGSPYSLMRTAERPSSFYEDGTVRVSGIYLGPDTLTMTAGDTLLTEVLVTPANATNGEYLIEITGDTDAVTWDPESGTLTAVSAGIVRLEAISGENSSINFSREIQVNEIPVTSVTITPSSAQVDVGDTLYLVVEVWPGDATDPSYYLDVMDSAFVVQVDSASGMVVALNPGSAQIIARWTRGEVSGTLDITVSDPASVSNAKLDPVIRMFPNPNHDRSLFVSCSMEIPVHLKILDLAGNLMIESRYNGSTTIDTSTLPPGTYLVIHTSKDYIFRDKLVTL